jgi:diacylglycerol kinase family enzyme
MLTGRGLRGRSVLALPDLTQFRISADRPVHLQVDGDYLGEREQMSFESHPAALRVIC